MAENRLEVLDDTEAVHRRGAEIIAEAIRTDLSERGHCALAVSGGRDPWAMFSQLEEFELDWREIEIFQVDERVAPAGSPERNLTHLVESLSIGAQGSIRPMPVTDDDLEAAADRYAASLPDALASRIWASAPTPPRVAGARRPVLEVTDKGRRDRPGEYRGSAHDPHPSGAPPHPGCSGSSPGRTRSTPCAS